MWQDRNTMLISPISIPSQSFQGHNRVIASLQSQKMHQHTLSHKGNWFWKVNPKCINLYSWRKSEHPERIQTYKWMQFKQYTNIHELGFKSWISFFFFCYDELVQLKILCRRIIIGWNCMYTIKNTMLSRFHRTLVCMMCPSAIMTLQGRILHENKVA